MSEALNQLVDSLAARLARTKRGGAVHERDFETREDFEAEARRRGSSVIIYSTEPLDFEVPGVLVNLPEIDDL